LNEAPGTVARWEGTVSNWEKTLSRFNLLASAKIADLCPGSDAKVEAALSSLGYSGKVLAVDLSGQRLRELERDAASGPFRLLPLCANIACTPLPPCDAIVSNHPIDDLALYFFAVKRGRDYDFYFENFRKDPEFSRRIWGEIAADAGIREDVVGLLCGIALRDRRAGHFAISQYESKYERQNGMAAETAFCKSVLEEVGRRLVASGEFAREESERSWLVLKRAEKGSFTKLCLNLTENCNLSCVDCCSDAKSGGAAAGIGLDIIKLVAGGFPPRTCSIKLSGGEPFCYSHLANATAILSGEGFGITITTNGTLHYMRTIDALRESEPAIKVSIRGPERIHDAITGTKGSFQRAIGGIRLFLKDGFDVCIQTGVHFGDAAACLGIVDIAKQEGVRKISVLSLIEQGRAASFGLVSCKEEFFARVEGMRHHAERISWGGEIKPKYWQADGHYVIIGPDGDVSANPVKNTEGRIVFGSILKDSPETLWEKYPYKEAHLNQKS
jgi:MoaA/NifB/PqqE/SkfB family radical SAM enzyme